MIDISSQQPIDRRCGQETHLQASIVTAREAGFALVADEVRFNGNAVPQLEVGD